jgi:hypothetical protein
MVYPKFNTLSKSAVDWRNQAWSGGKSRILRHVLLIGNANLVSFLYDSGDVFCQVIPIFVSLNSTVTGGPSWRNLSKPHLVATACSVCWSISLPASRFRSSPFTGLLCEGRHLVCGSLLCYVGTPLSWSAHAVWNIWRNDCDASAA